MIRRSLKTQFCSKNRNIVGIVGTSYKSKCRPPLWNKPDWEKVAE
jgi:hypothetical protein